MEAAIAPTCSAEDWVKVDLRKSDFITIHYRTRQCQLNFCSGNGDCIDCPGMLNLPVLKRMMPPEQYWQVSYYMSFRRREGVAFAMAEET